MNENNLIPNKKQPKSANLHEQWYQLHLLAGKLSFNTIESVISQFRQQFQSYENIDHICHKLKYLWLSNMKLFHHLPFPPSSSMIGNGVFGDQPIQNHHWNDTMKILDDYHVPHQSNFNEYQASKPKKMMISPYNKKRKNSELQYFDMEHNSKKNILTFTIPFQPKVLEEIEPKAKKIASRISNRFSNLVLPPLINNTILLNDTTDDPIDLYQNDDDDDHNDIFNSITFDDDIQIDNDITKTINATTSLSTAAVTAKSSSSSSSSSTSSSPSTSEKIKSTLGANILGEQLEKSKFIFEELKEQLFKIRIEYGQEQANKDYDDLTLHPTEDPSIPLDEADTVIMGKLSRRVYRKPGEWNIKLKDVYMQFQGKDYILPASLLNIDTTSLIQDGRKQQSQENHLS